METLWLRVSPSFRPSLVTFPSLTSLKNKKLLWCYAFNGYCATAFAQGGKHWAAAKAWLVNVRVVLSEQSEQSES